MADTDQRSLADITIFSDLDADTLSDIEARCRWRNYAPQEQIIDFQDESKDVFFVTRGTVRVVNYSISGREVTFDDIQAGQIFGELAALDGERRSANIVAITPTTVASMSPAAFQDMLLAKPDIALRLMRRLARIIRISVERIMDLSTLGANNRVYAEILRLAKKSDQEGDRAIISPVPIHGEIASRVSTTRETVARVMSDLARKGLVKRKGNILEISDLTILQDMVEEFRGD
ncbi:Crp/Fnr family transcriptional regulator [Marivibrio halodurans]|uniref:Crp/Fnr family transcriptional regulator n=1 Tax=Marivibrio halodurans TaxID=2039722 RepID=A0A8J7RW67_9PROT|nr:Crp/Fnr family transcriptional regulator [Marivibrio halodurans]MBP5855505.1 Crp/Fnr family transcriptional regulator [Marivibrio halodurans]